MHADFYLPVVIFSESSCSFSNWLFTELRMNAWAVASLLLYSICDYYPVLIFYLQYLWYIYQSRDRFPHGQNLDNFIQQCTVLPAGVDPCILYLNASTLPLNPI